MKRKFIKIMGTEETPETTEEVTTEKEECKMSFFAKHKKGIIFGGIGALAAAGAAWYLKHKNNEEEDFDDDLDDEDYFEDEGDQTTEES